MQNTEGSPDQSNLILNLEAVSHLDQKHKFWDTSITGNQRSPKNLKLVNQMEQMQQDEANRFDGVDTAPHNLNQGDDPDSEGDDEEEDDNTSRRQRIERIKLLEEETEALRARIQQHRVLNHNLVKQLNKTTNQLRVAEDLNQQLNAECDKLYKSVKQTYDKHSLVQNQKMQLLIQISTLNQQKQLALNKSQILEEQTEYLNKKIETLYEQNSFQKSISADLKKQTLILKQQLNKMLTIMQNYSQLQQQVARTHTINTQIQQRVLKLEQQLKQTRLKVEESEANQEKYMEEQNKLFLTVEELDAQNKISLEKISLLQKELKVKNQEFSNVQNKQTDYEGRYVKILEEMDKRNEDLVFELLAVTQRNHKLLDQRDFYMRRVEATLTNRNQRLPYDQFVSILSATDSQVQSFKLKLQLKNDELQQHLLQHEQQSLNYQQKISELTNLLEIKDRQLQNREQMTQNQIHIYKKQCQLVVRRNEQLKNNQVKLRLQIIEKDRIIMEFVERQKLAEERRLSQQRRASQALNRAQARRTDAQNVQNRQQAKPNGQEQTKIIDEVNRLSNGLKNGQFNGQSSNIQNTQKLSPNSSYQSNQQNVSTVQNSQQSLNGSYYLGSYNANKNLNASTSGKISSLNQLSNSSSIHNLEGAVNNGFSQNVGSNLTTNSQFLQPQNGLERGSQSLQSSLNIQNKVYSPYTYSSYSQQSRV